jgi:16S rRNA (adenine1518-N6/adenine1519-N6)-dimethyltransferase
VRARKRFGQHFLHDPIVLDKIVSAISPRVGDHLVEIGPGRGALTRALLEQWPESGATLDVIEIDRDLVPLLRDEFGGPESASAATSGALAREAHAPASDDSSPSSAGPATAVRIHEADALEFDFTALAAERGGRLRVVGNLPYNISTPLLFHLLDHAAVIEDMHVMLQREVVDRIAARPGTADYGRLTVMLAPWVEAEALFDVGPGAFQPPPRVWSAVVRLTVRQQPAFPVSPHFAGVVSAAFSHRRKTIRNALRDLVSAEQISTCGVDPGLRPETLAPESFNQLARMLD